MISRVRPPENSVEAGSLAAWRRWLSRNHARGEGVWLVTFKKSSGKAGLTYDAAVEEALCWGWIDSRERALDATRTMLWMSPRKPRSAWSRSNKERIAKLEAAGRLEPPGLARIEAARADGSWNALDAVEALELPDDLRAALANHAAVDRFQAFARSVRRPILEWIHQAKRPETRARRVEETARLAAMDIPAPLWRKR